MYVAGGNAIQYGVTVIQPTADERTHQGSPGFERQAAFDAAQLSELVEAAADDMADMSSHC